MMTHQLALFERGILVSITVLLFLLTLRLYAGPIPVHLGLGLIRGNLNVDVNNGIGGTFDVDVR